MEEYLAELDFDREDICTRTNWRKNVMNRDSYPIVNRTIHLGYDICDLRANLLVACKVIPAIWLNLSDSMIILIIHFGLLLKERTLDSIGHDLLKTIIT